MHTPSRTLPARPRPSVCTFPAYPAIGLVGPAGAGKDTVADYLVIHAGFRKYSFASALRLEIAWAYGIDEELLLERETKETPLERLALRECGSDRFICHLLPLFEGPEPKLDMTTPLSPRTLMQHWGDFRRHQHPDYWVGQARAAIHTDWATHGTPAGIVLADCRYDNEVTMVRGYLGGMVWQVQRPGVEAKPGHDSESSGAQFAPETLLINGGTIPELHVSTMLALAEATKGGAL